MTQSRRGFSLVELLFVILIIFMLVGLLIGGFRFATRYSKRTADRASVASLSQALAQFQQEMGFAPPLLKDMGDQAGFGGQPIVAVNGEHRPLAYQLTTPLDVEFLRTSPPADQPDMRFSIYTFAYYLIGACEVNRTVGGTGQPIDGVPGPGFLKPLKEGRFERSGKRFEAFFDVGKRGKSLVTYDLPGDPASLAGCRVELRDSNGVAYRFYRWEHGQPTGNLIGQVIDPDDLNIPVILGDPEVNDDLKSAKWAIVGAGPDGVFGNEDQLLADVPGHPQGLTRQAMVAKMGMNGDPNDDTFMDRVRQRAIEDNVVEVGS